MPGEEYSKCHCIHSHQCLFSRQRTRLTGRDITQCEEKTRSTNILNRKVQFKCLLKAVQVEQDVISRSQIQEDDGVNLTNGTVTLC